MEYIGFAKIIYDALTTNLSKSITKLAIKKIEESVNIKESINNHCDFVNNWSKEVKFNDLSKSKNTRSVYVHLDTFIYPRTTNYERYQKPPKKPLLEVLKEEKRHILISGQPGSGKTTSMKFLCQKIFQKKSEEPKYQTFPILVKIRELNKKFEESENESKRRNNRILYKELEDIIGLRDLRSIISQIAHLNNEEEYNDDLIEKEYERKMHIIINRLKPIIIIDGIDEIFSNNLREIIIKNIANLSLNLSDSRMIITTRTGDLFYSFDRVDHFEISPLGSAQIIDFAKKWLINEKSVNHFLSEIGNSPFRDTTIKPLTLAHLCAIYEKSGKIPDKPKTVYKKIINLLLEEWDEQRLIKRFSKYANFEVDRKFEFLSNLSFELTTCYRGSIFNISDVENVYKRIYVNYDLIENEAELVSRELESHTGLFVQSGYEDYEFVHKSIQEYLCAEYLIKLPSLLNDHKLIKILPNELAVSVSLSSSPSQYFADLVLRKLYNYQLKLNYISTFVTRLLQEKPNFNNDSKVIIALFALYSKYFEIENEVGSGQLILIPINPSFVNFELMLSESCKRNSLDVITKYYVITDENYSYDDPVLTLEKLEGVRKAIPIKLYSRKSFLRDVYRQLK